MQLPEPACFTRGCKHFGGIRDDDEGVIIFCKAFPDGIPQDILDGEDLHLEPREGDHGIQFEVEPARKFTWTPDELADMLESAE